MKTGMVASTAKTGIGQFLGVLLAAVSVKVLAILAGPAGIGLFSILRNLQQTLSSVASLGGQNAVVQGVSSRLGAEKQDYLCTSFYLFVAAGVLLGSGMFLGAQRLADWVLAGEHASSIRWLTVPVFLGSLLIYFRGMLTAEMRYGALAVVNVSAGLGAVLVAFPVGLAYAKGYYDALVGVLVAGLLLGLAASLFYVHRLRLFRTLFFFSAARPSLKAARGFLHVALPSLVSLLLAQGSLLAVRSQVVTLYGLEGAGQFDAAWSVSAMYLAIFLASLQSYLLPEMSRPATEFSQALAKAFQFALLISIPLIVFLISFKPLVVRVLFSGEFSPALNILRWMLLGDCVRVAGWIIATALLARADMRGFIGAETCWSLIFLLAAMFLLPMGLEWVGLAYLAGYCGYFLGLLWRIRRVHGISLPLSTMTTWGAGLLFVALTTWICWSVQALYSWHMLLVLPALLFSFVIMRPGERQHAWRMLVWGVQRIRR